MDRPRITDRTDGLSRIMIAYRERTGYTQTECAAAARVSKQTWYSIEHGYQKPKPETAERIRSIVEGK